ncbi:MAG: 4-hydroxythreonine-4-phosphate dehydrogenase PdxA, partial [Candidatus Electrothrix sp. AR3]|nr:4-hydroxythreonine-4-phosphate dehydrogenase PdxA [Candidatus Electrothrix sp. AR3]
MQPAAITMGCPAGIGPEIILRLFDGFEGTEVEAPPVVLGDLGVLTRTAALLNNKSKPVRWQRGQEIKAGTVPVLESSQLEEKNIAWGQPNQATSRAMAEYIRRAVQGCLEGDFSALVTCPISKKSLNEAGIHYPGHTEMLADLTGAGRYRMMMAGTQLRVVLVTIHEALAKVSELLSLEKIIDCIEMTAQALQ